MRRLARYVSLSVLATGFSPLVSMLMLLSHLKSPKRGFAPVKVPFRFSAVRSILSLGFPALVSQLSGGVVMIVFNLLMLRLRGNVGVAAYGVVANLSLVITGVFTGVAEGAQPLFSKCAGGGSRAGLRRYLRYALITETALALALYGMLAAFAQPLAGVFNSEGNEALQKLAQTGIRLYFTSNLMLALNVLLCQFFAAVEWPGPSQILSLLRGLALIVPLAAGMTALWQTNGLWLACTAAETITLVLALWWLKRCPALSSVVQ